MIYDTLRVALPVLFVIVVLVVGMVCGAFGFKIFIRYL